VYARAGFMVQTILMDNEFEKVKNHIQLAHLNTPAAKEYISKIKRLVLVIKEHCHGIIFTLPYTCIPQTMLIHLLHHVVMCLINFSVAKRYFRSIQSTRDNSPPQT
jgi:hypothetical protein